MMRKISEILEIYYYPPSFLYMFVDPFIYFLIIFGSYVSIIKFHAELFFNMHFISIHVLKVRGDNIQASRNFVHTSFCVDFQSEEAKSLEHFGKTSGHI